MEIIRHFKALSDETRLKLLYLLYRHELNVNEIVNLMEMGQSRISRHLKILTECGLLSSRRDGLWVFYSAAREGRGADLMRFLNIFMEKDDELTVAYSEHEKSLHLDFREKQRFFDSLAPDWDNIKHEIIGDLDIVKEISGRIGPSSVAVDLGCGTGELMLLLANQAERVIGIDNSAEMLRESKKRCAGADSIEFRIGAMEHLPMREGEADSAVINMVLHHLPSPLEALREAGRVVKEGGSLIVVELKKHTSEVMRLRYGHRWLGFEAAEMEEWLCDADFSTIARESFPALQGMTIVLYHARKGDTAASKDVLKQ